MMKKMIATIASLAMFAGTCAMPVAAEETTTYALGDVTMDGKIGLDDARTVLRYYCQYVAHTPAEHNPWLNEEQLPFADVTGDGIVDLVDASRILCYYAYTLTTDEPISSDEYFELSRDERNQLPMAELEFPNG